VKTTVLCGGDLLGPPTLNWCPLASFMLATALGIILSFSTRSQYKRWTFFRQTVTEILLKSILNNTADGMNNQSLRLSGVLYYPTLANNLISVAQFTDDGYIVKFTKYTSQFIDSNDNLIAVAPRVRTAYLLHCHG